MTTKLLHFKARTHILSLLGDQLIGSDNLAIFELVKNAYDADAEEVCVTFKNLNTSKQSIVIEDNGFGMSADILEKVWLEIGTNSKRGENRKPTPKYKRIALGEKGVGRLAVHKLGKTITLESKTEDNTYSCRFTINWAEIIESSEYIEGAQVKLEILDCNLFPEYNHGTRIIIQNLKKQTWSKKNLRDLVRKINTIKNPFRSIQKFDVKVNVDSPYANWISDLKSTDDMLNEAMYNFNFYLDRNANLTWTYRFNPPKLTEVASRKVVGWKQLLKLVNPDLFEIGEEAGDHKKSKEKQIHLKNINLEGIGPLFGRFYVYNLSDGILRLLGQKDNMKQFIKENCGVKLYRDGIRVYNYGEPNDDWLGLDLRRVQRSGNKFSKNIVIGAIELSLQESFNGLKEKTNREGFEDSIYFERLKDISESIFSVLEITAASDRQKISTYLDTMKPIKRVGFSDTINDLKVKVIEKNVDKDLLPLIGRVEKDYATMRDVMVSSGMTGINLGLIFHEVEREVQFLNTEIEQEFDIKQIKERIKNLNSIIENFTPLVRQNKNIIINASKLIERLKQIESSRFLIHDVIFSSPLLYGETEDFPIKGPGNLLLSSLGNIVDNAIYWTSSQREIVDKKEFKSRIYITTNTKDFGGNAIIIADNGEGFKLEEDELKQPFKTTRPNGMGLGLYFVELVMNMLGGKLIFLNSDEIELPKGLDGAVVVLVFPKNQ
nr:MAG TPA: Histidine kinase-, DNA gyrase B-, and HSP90-like ATPase [Caudoviricetes sp.]